MDKTTKIVLIIALVALLLMFVSLGRDLFKGISLPVTHTQSAVSHTQTVSAAS